MKPKKLFIATLLYFISLLLVCSVQAAPIKLRFNYTMPLKKSIAASWHWYGDQIEKQTNGKVTFEYFPMGGLFSNRQLRENMIAGTADLCHLSISTEGPRMPFSNITSLPTIYFPNTIEGTMAATSAAEQLINEFPELAAEFSDFKIIAYQYLTSYGLLMKSPAYLPSALKGQKIRAAAMHAEFIKLVGGGPVNIIPPKVYMSLKTGVVDGSIINFNQISDYKLWEIRKAYTDIYLGRTMFAIIMNQESWNALPKDVQQMMDNLSGKMVEKGAEIMHSEHAMAEKRYTEAGGKIIELTPEQEKAWDDAKAPLETLWLENLRNKGKGEVAEKMLKRFKEIAAEKIKNL